MREMRSGGRWGEEKEEDEERRKEEREVEGTRNEVERGGRRRKRGENVCKKKMDGFRRVGGMEERREEWRWKG